MNYIVKRCEKNGEHFWILLTNLKLGLVWRFVPCPLSSPASSVEVRLKHSLTSNLKSESFGWPLRSYKANKCKYSIYIYMHILYNNFSQGSKNKHEEKSERNSRPSLGVGFAWLVGLCWPYHPLPSNISIFFCRPSRWTCETMWNTALKQHASSAIRELMSSIRTWPRYLSERCDMHNSSVEQIGPCFACLQKQPWDTVLDAWTLCTWPTPTSKNSNVQAQIRNHQNMFFVPEGFLLDFRPEIPTFAKARVNETNQPCGHVRLTS